MLADCFRFQTDLSSNSVRFAWAQQPIVHKFKVKLINLGSEQVFDVRTDGWSQEITSISLEAGSKYDIEVIPISYGKEGESLFLSESTYPKSPVENAAARRFDSTTIDIEVVYFGDVQVNSDFHLVTSLLQFLLYYLPTFETVTKSWEVLMLISCETIVDRIDYEKKKRCGPILWINIPCLTNFGYKKSLGNLWEDFLFQCARPCN